MYAIRSYYAEPTPPPEPAQHLREQLARRAARRERARREGPRSLWLSLGMMGGNSGDADTQARRYLYPEKIFQQFEGDGASWTQFDPRVDWLLELLKSARQEKVLVICSEAATALTLVV